MIKACLRFWVLCLSVTTGLLEGCSDAGEEAANTLAVRASQVSECGGFGTSDMALTDVSAKSDYCDAELLEWSYDKESAVLSLLNTRVMLNCCGDHGFQTELAEDNTYTVTETDYPVKVSGGGYDRCACECVFDFEISLEEMPAEEIAFKLQRDVKEADSVQVVWEGKLNLSESSVGNVIVTSEEEAFPCNMGAE